MTACGPGQRLPTYIAYRRRRRHGSRP
jgi:hypothetical protein